MAPDPSTAGSPPILGIQGIWSHGATESLARAYEIAAEGTDGGRRIAFVLADNAVEVAIKTYLKLSPASRGPGRAKISTQANFGELVDAMLQLFPAGSIEGVDLERARHFHRLRNVLYHEGNGINPDAIQVEGYLDLANNLLRVLFVADVHGVSAVAPTASPAAERPTDTVTLTMSELLRRAATSVVVRRTRWPNAPLHFVATSDVWDVFTDAVDYFNVLCFDGIGPDAFEFAQDVSSSWDWPDPETTSIDELIAGLYELAGDIDALTGHVAENHESEPAAERDDIPGRGHAGDTGRSKST